MGRELNVPKEKIKEYYESLQEARELFNNALPNNGIDTLKDYKGRIIDGRDLTDLALSFELKGKTKEERQIEMNNYVKEMVDAIKSPDPNVNRKFFDKVFDLLDQSKEYIDKKIESANDFKKVFAIASMNQAIATKRNENIPYYLNRYNTQEKRNKKMIDTAANLTLNCMVADFLTTNHLEIKGREMLGSYLANITNYDYYTNLGESSISGNTISLKMPTKIIDQTKVVDGEPSALLLENIITGSDLQVTFGKYLNKDVEDTKITKNYNDFVFIGDKRLSDIAKEQLKGEEKAFRYNKKVSELADNIFRKELLAGKNPISVAIPQYLNNRYSVNVLKIKPDMQDLCEKLMEEKKDNLTLELPEQKDVDKAYENSERFDNSIIEQTNKYMLKEKIAYRKNEIGDFSGIKIPSDEVFREGYELYMAHRTMLEKAYRALNLTSKEILDFDVRDLQEIAMCIDLDGIKEEDKQNVLNEKMQEMFSAFKNGDENKKKEYLDILYSSYEKSEKLITKGVNTPTDACEAFKSYRLSQTLGTKARENPEYYKNRFINEYEFRQFNALQMAHIGLDDKIFNKYTKFSNDMDMPTFPMKDLIIQFAEDNLKAVAANKKNIKVNLPASFNNRNKEDDLRRFEIFYQQINASSDISQIVKRDKGIDLVSKGSSCNKTFFIDGIDLETLATQKLRNTDEFKDPTKAIGKETMDNACTNLVKDAFMKGNKVISYIEPFETAKGVRYSVRNIIPNLAAVREAERSKYTLFRRVFFDWGPFKIDCPPKQSDIDKLYSEKDYSDKIINNFNKQISDAQEKNRVQENSEKNKELSTNKDLRKSIDKDINIEIEIDNNTISTSKNSVREVNKKSNTLE